MWPEGLECLASSSELDRVARDNPYRWLQFAISDYKKAKCGVHTNDNQIISYSLHNQNDVHLKSGQSRGKRPNFQNWSASDTWFKNIYEVMLCINSRFMLAVVVVLFSLFNGCATASPDFSFPDIQQGQFAQNLNNFHISWPSMVNHLGEFVSRDVYVKHAVARSRRSLTDDEDASASISSTSKTAGAADNQIDNTALLHYRIEIHPEQEVIVRITRTNLVLAPSALLERKVSKFRNVSDSVFSNLDHHHGCHYAGDVQGHSNSIVALSACHGLRGFLQLGGIDYLIEPVKGHNKSKDGGQPHLVYKRSSLPETMDFMARAKRHGPTCGVKVGDDRSTKHREMYERHKRSMSRRHSEESTHGRRKRSISIEKHVETLVVVDTEMVKYYEKEDIETYVLTVMNMVATLFHDASIGNAVNIVIVRIILMEDQDEELQITHHADKTLKSFCKWQKNINFRDDDHPNHHDVAVLLTRKNICSRNNEPCSTLGLAHVSGLCQPHRTCNINEDTGLSLAWTVAHEIGHNFGMKHDNQHSDCMSDSETPHVMAPHLSWDKTPTSWSNCSRASITKFLDRNWGYCLDDPPGHHDFKYPELPAGTMYDADHQCRLLYGDGAERCTGIEVLENICTTLWCRVNNKCSTKLQPAAVGTICGHDKWCFAGQCVDMNDRPQAIDGQWSQWEEWTDCTRTCGAGVSVSQRHCSHPPPSNSGKYCTGERKRYRICNTENCPGDEPSFRTQQCTEFNGIPYKGTLYEWEPISTPDTPCQLHCKPKNLFFSVLLKDIVTDGTPCVISSRHMCISGRCRHVGCDWILDSSAVEDHCGVCFGDGSTCKTIKQQFNETKHQGYVEATVIPAGARNIRVEEVAEASNFLALKNEAGEYYLNGHWFIQWSGDYEMAGTVIHYKRIGNKEQFLAPGPLKEPLHIMLLMQTHNPGVEFEYTVPMENAISSRKPEFSWEYMDWSHCTVSCGGGTQRSSVVCKEQEAGLVDEMYCDQTTKLDDQLRECNVHQCPARWWTGPWQHCSVTCGDLGTHHRTVICVRSLGSDEQIALEDQACEGLDKPVEMEPCHHKDACPGLGVWKVEEWSNCTRQCNGGVQFRKVTCIGGIRCGDEKPGMKQPCNVHKCIENNKQGILNIEEGVTEIGNDFLPRDIISHYSLSSLSSSSGINSISNNYTLHPLRAGVKNSLIGDSSSNSIKDDPNMFSHVHTSNTHSQKPKHHHDHSHNRSSHQYVVTSLAPDSKSGMLTTGKMHNKAGHRTVVENTRNESLDNLQKNGVNSQFIWQTLEWSKCSATCGYAIKNREVFCTNPGHCDLSQKPDVARICDNLSPCIAWVYGDWSKCTKSCGVGSQERLVQCVNLTSQQLSEGCPAQTRPSLKQKCNEDDCPADDNAALTVSCESNEMSFNVCRMLKKVGLCHKQYVRTKCCRTCHNDARPKPDEPSMSRR